MTPNIENLEPIIKVFTDTISNELEEKMKLFIQSELNKYSVEKKIPAYLNTTQFYEYTGITQRKQCTLRKNHKIPYIQNGRSISYKREDVEAFMEQHRVL